MMDKAETFWITGPRKGEIRTQALSPKAPGALLVKTLYSALSRGTEGLVWRGQVPESQRSAMRAPFQEGDFPFPVKYGYIAVGEVLEGPEPWPGRRIFALHPHQSHFRLPPEHATLLPEGLPSRRAVLGANMESALNSLWDAGPLSGKRVAVIGAGVVGCLVARLVKKQGGAVTLVDLDPGKALAAKELDLEFRAPGEVPGDVDVIFHASGSPAGLRSALDLAGVEGVILEMSWYGDQEVCLPLGESFHSRRLTLRSTQVGRLSPNAPVASFAGRMALALEELRDPCYDALINSEGRFRDLPNDMERILAPGSGVLCHLVRY